MLLRSGPWTTRNALVGRADGRQGRSCIPGAPTATLTSRRQGMSDAGWRGCTEWLNEPMKQGQANSAALGAPVPGGPPGAPARGRTRAEESCMRPAPGGG